MIGYRFTEYIPDDSEKDPFERLLKIFKELLLHTSGEVSEALSWLTELDKQYELTTPDYGIADFIEDLKKKGYIQDPERKGNPANMSPTSKMELELRKKALDDIFDQLKKSKKGKHSTKSVGQGDELTAEIRPYEFGDKLAKRVAMALSELITTRYQNDTLDIIVFGNDAWQIQIKDLPYLQVGPYHTNTVAGLELAMDILRKRKNPNKQIMMITDGKPTCIKKGKRYIKNSHGLDKNILNRTLALAVKCRKLQIPITTFMIARDPYLVQFVDQFTKTNNGKAFYSSLQGLGEFIFMDYKNNKKKKR